MTGRKHKPGANRSPAEISEFDPKVESRARIPRSGQPRAERRQSTHLSSGPPTGSNRIRTEGNSRRRCRSWGSRIKNARDDVPQAQYEMVLFLSYQILAIPSTTGAGRQGQGVQLYSGTKSNHSISRRRPPVEGQLQSVKPSAKGLRFPGIAGPDCFPEQPAREPVVNCRVIDGVL